MPMLAPLLFAAGLHASETLVVGHPRNAGDEATIRALDFESGRAVRARDYTTLERIWSERFVVNAPNGRIYPNRAAVLDGFRKSTADLYSSYQKNIECIAFDADLAIVMGVETVTPVGTNKSAQRRYTNVWRFANDAWLLIARQATIVPDDAVVAAGAKTK
jgi:ketosteroid isomerase-like protein